MLCIESVKKLFIDGSQCKCILNIPSLKIIEGKSIVITGYSGSGKTTLLNIISGLLLPDEGDVFVNNMNITKLKEVERDLFRANNIGYVFQDYKLFLNLTALHNVMLGASFGSYKNKKEVFRRSVEVLSRVGLDDKMHIKAGKLSGGEKQRVAIARSIANKPRLILADEPTGSLDADNSDNIIKILTQSVRELNTTLLLITHDLQYIRSFDECMDMADINKCCRRGNEIDISVG